MRKHFNNAGPVNKDNMYKIDPLKRWELQEVLDLIEKEKYFIMHAPRQTGKTSCMLALRDYLNKEGKYFAVYVNVEMGQAAKHNTNSSIRAINGALRMRLEHLNVDENILSQLKKINDEVDVNIALTNAFTCLSSAMSKPVVVFIDEIDALIGDSLISVLRQIRSGYDQRPEKFPASIVLCGIRDVRDYRIVSSNNEIITGGSAFNIKAKSLSIENFSIDEVKELYLQHTTETGQVFEDDIYDLVMDYTNGQPWLVNALANEVVWEMKENRDHSVIITKDKLAEAKERLILRRDTHLDQLVDKLKEDRVRNVILPMLLGDEYIPQPDDAKYCIDLGLIKQTRAGLEISNSIYQEIIPRELTWDEQNNMLARFKPNWINTDGSLNINTLLTLFKDFWNENSTIWGSNLPGYREAAPQLVFQAFMQRVINGGGTINREYALGTGQTDLYIKWQYEYEKKLCIQNIVIEIKVIHKNWSYETTKKAAIEQTAHYAKACGEKEAYILIFDRENKMKWQADEPNENIEHEGVKLEIWKLGAGIFSQLEIRN